MAAPQNTTDYSDLKALYFNGTLKRSPETSNTEGLIEVSRRIIVENLTWAGLYNGLVLPFAAIGWITPGWAAIGMSLSSLVVVVNALRLSSVTDSSPASAAGHAPELPPAIPSRT